MAPIKHWIHSFRLRTLPLALSTTLSGSIAASIYNSFQWDIFTWACLTTLFLQILSNLANDYGDAVSGVDKHRIGPARMVQSGHITKSTMLTMIIVFILLSLISGIVLIYLAFPDFASLRSILFLITGIAAIGAALNYTMGKNPYGYRGWGDFFVFIFFGIVGSVGTFFLHTKSINLLVLLPALFVGALSVGVLNINNLRDQETDKKANKRSLIVIYGHQFGVAYHFILITTAISSLVIFTILIEHSFYKWLFLLMIPIYILHLKRVITITSLPLYNKELKVLALSTFITTLLWGAGITLF